MAENSPAAQMKAAEASTSLEREVNGKEIDFINKNRHKLIPKKQQDKIPVIENWPEVHPEMELTELIAARGSLMEALKSIKPGNSFHKFIGLFNDADAACNDAWAVAKTLHGLVAKMPSYGTNELGLSYLLDRSAVRDTEKAVEKLTCILLAPNNVEILGSISTRISLLKLTVERVERYMREARSWKCIGDKLIKGMNEGNEQFIRGVLEALEACYVGGKDREDTIDPRSYLIATGTSTRIMRRHHATDTTMEGLDQEATSIAPAIGKRNRQPLPQHLTTKSKNGEIPGSQSSKRSKYNRDTTSNNYPVLSPTNTSYSNYPSIRKSNRLHPITSLTTSITSHGPREQETRAHEDSDSTTDEDDPDETRELFEIAKSIYNAQMPPRPKPEVKPNQETPSMEAFRMEVEAVDLAEDTVHGIEFKMESDEKNDGPNVTMDEMNNHCDHFQSAVMIYDDHSDEGIGDE